MTTVPERPAELSIGDLSALGEVPLARLDEQPRRTVAVLRRIVDRAATGLRVAAFNSALD